MFLKEMLCIYLVIRNISFYLNRNKINQMYIYINRVCYALLCVSLIDTKPNESENNVLSYTCLMYRC